MLIGNQEISNIFTGNNAVDTIYVKDQEAWPGYVYSLELVEVHYVDDNDQVTQSKLYSSGSNCCIFLCHYNKYTPGGRLISYESVYATPTLGQNTHCIMEYRHVDQPVLRFNYNTYKTTTIANDFTETVSISYNGYTINNVTVNIQQNTSSTYTEFTSDFVLINNNGSVTAKGAGDSQHNDIPAVQFYRPIAQQHRKWTSQYDEVINSDVSVTYNSPGNSSNSDFVGHASRSDGNTGIIIIPSLETTVVGSGYYIFEAEASTDSKPKTSITISQEANSVTSTVYAYNAYKNNELVNNNSYIQVSADAQSIQILINETITRTFTSEKTSSVTNNISNANVTYGATQNSGCVSGYSAPSSGNIYYTINISANNTTYQQSSFVTFYTNNLNLTLYFNQSAPPYINLSSYSSNAAYGGDSGSFTVSTNISPWSVSSDSNWLSVSSSGSTIYWSVSANSGSSSRSGYITISGSNKSATFTVTQLGYTFGVDFSDIINSDFGVTGGNKTITVTNPDGYSWSVSNNSGGWLTTTTSGNSITVSASSNQSSQSRNATITVSENTYNRTYSQSVDQDGFEFYLSPQFVGGNAFAATGETKYLDIYDPGYLGWTVYTKPNWVNLSSNSGSGNSTISVQIGANNNTTSRSGQIQIQNNTFTNVIITCTIEQAANYQFDYNPQSLSFDSSADTKYITITTSGNWSVEVPLMYRDWITVGDGVDMYDSYYGQGTSNLYIAVEQNTSGSYRTAELELYDENYTTYNITIEQYS